MSFQNRLSHFQDKRNTRLVQNDISRSGVHTDLVHIKTFRDEQYDERRMEIAGFQFTPVVFPFEVLEGMQTRLGTTPEGKTISFLSTEESSFDIYINSTSIELFPTKDDMLFWMVENHTHNSMEPAILLLRVSDVVSHFGSYGIIYHGYKCVTSDPSTLPDVLISKLQEAYVKRQVEFLASHARTQLEP